jgi:secreted trypsin-like serine protease
VLLKVRTLLAVAISAVLTVGATAGPRAPTSAPSLDRPAASLVALVNASAPTANLFAGQFCGAVLIGPREVLTVAHCLRHTDPRAVDAVVGAGNLCQGRPVTGQRIHVAAVDAPPAGTGSDVVLLTLDRAASATPARINDVPAGDGQMGLAQGWGRSSLLGGYPCLPRTVPVAAGPADACRDGLSAAVAPQPTRDVWCATGSGPSNTCVGDSGGPVYASTDPDVLLALTSWGIRDCAPQTPAYYSRVHPRPGPPWGATSSTSAPDLARLPPFGEEPEP